MAHEEDRGPTWRYLAVGASTLLLTLVGYIIGDFVSDIRDRVASIQHTLDSRAGLAPRVETLERADLDKEGRLRVIEQEHWKRELRR